MPDCVRQRCSSSAQICPSCQEKQTEIKTSTTAAAPRMSAPFRPRRQVRDRLQFSWGEAELWNESIQSGLDTLVELKQISNSLPAREE